MHYRRRLRSRIIVSFLLLGFGQTAAFALATLALQSRLEGSLVDGWLQSEATNFLQFKRAHPEEDAAFTFSRQIEAFAYRRDSANIPLGWRELPRGVHDLREVGPDGVLRDYKLAVQREPDMVTFIRYDYSQEALTQQQLVYTLVVAVFVFTGLAWAIGLWSSSRVISPLTELARRVGGLAGKDSPDKLAPHFPPDEVGELASALDEYAARMTRLVRRDREFNADVSHELRTPLAVIRGAAELLLANPELPPKTRQRLERIERAALQCTDLTTALLLLSRNERGHGATDVGKVVDQLLDAHRAQLAGKPLQLLVDGERGMIVDAPEAAVAVALGNLIGNAVKYTLEGEVVVRLHANSVEVIDSGPGLSPEDAARLFERGYRGTHAGHSQGGGIGLSIVRRLCALYGWDVRVEPGKERGVTALLTFG